MEQQSNRRPLYRIDDAFFTRLQPGEVEGMRVRLQVIGRNFENVGIPLTARVGAQWVYSLTIAPEGFGFEGFLRQSPRPGDRLTIGYGRPDMFETNVVVPTPNIS